MSKYPKSLIDELALALEPGHKRYFEKSKAMYNYGCDTFEELVKSVLEEILEFSMDDVRVAYEKELGNRKSKRREWVKRTKLNRKQYPPSAPKSYFYSIIMEIIRDKTGYYYKKYNTDDINVIIDKIIEEIEIWHEERGNLVDFPNFPSIGNINVPNTLRSDIRLNLCVVIIDKYGGNISNWSIKQPYMMVNNPLFSAQRGRVPIENVNNKLFAQIFSSEDYDIRFTDITEDNAKNFDMSMPVLDNRDLEIVSWLINNMKIDIKKPSPIQSVQHTTVGEVAKMVLHADKPSANQREDIAKRLERFTTPIELKNKKTGKYYSWVILSAITVDEPDASGRRDVEYTIGSILNNAVIQNRLISVPSSKFNRLVNDYAKTLYFRLQMERIVLSTQHAEMQNLYTIDYLSRAMLIRYKAISRRKKIITDALEEIKVNGEIIEKYEVHAAAFTITFVPLSEEERKELIGEDDTFLLSDSDYSNYDLLEENIIDDIEQ